MAALPELQRRWSEEESQRCQWAQEALSLEERSGRGSPLAVFKVSETKVMLAKRTRIGQEANELFKVQYWLIDELLLLDSEPTAGYYCKLILFVPHQICYLM